MKHLSSVICGIVLLISGEATFAADGKSDPMIIHPGEVRFLKIHSEVKNAKLFCRNQEVRAYNDGKNEYVAYISESYFSELKPFECLLKDGEKELEKVSFKVEAKQYQIETLKVPPRLVKLSAKDQIRVDAETKMLKELYENSNAKPYFTEVFKQPLKSVITSPYGIKRVFNGDTNGQHLGYDFRAGIGKKISVSNTGKVVFAGELFRSGNIVIVDHGLGIFTQYHHLSKILVKKDQEVKQGQIIALAGNTGRVSGPHLHWGVNVQGEAVDGFSLVQASESEFTH
ncbi:M23 family metallopeptidase [Bdellovibrio sp. NC01]|uniref:M23 family metallopeptidase n=1 Tax=Bdellovibrio sp. NC01 TaxID=2220073 RepID=UPI00115B5A2F|nr:M23 family metallopeptidase [Bdellovibrio sp. NC01]QDK37567.1 M23 family peptidase [Bdellovibrio sp. NC01]